MSDAPRKPDFFIVGAAKCGTTSMSAYLRQHPQIYVPENQQPHKFGSDLDIRAGRKLSDEAYLALFEDAGDARRVGEASPWYLFSTKAAREIKAFNADARIIIMLRNPVDMLHAWHAQMVYMADEDILDFEEAVDAQDDRRAGRRIPPNTGRRNELQYSDVGAFTEQVRRYLDVFGPERVHVIIFDDFARDTMGTYRAVLEFLEIDPTFAPDLEAKNQGKWAKLPVVVKLLKRFPILRRAGMRIVPASARRRAVAAATTIFRPQKRPKITAEFRLQLQEHFEPEIARLGELLGRDLSAWCAKARVDS